MKVFDIIQKAFELQATDIHLEPQFPVVFRIKGELRKSQEPISLEWLQPCAEEILGAKNYHELLLSGSLDLTKTLFGVPCRIHGMKTDRGIGLAIRLLSPKVRTLVDCNLQPGLVDLLKRESGLIIVCGATGSGKTTTLAALVEEINQNQAKHIITFENPIEYRFVPKKSIIRQRQIGTHTPSVEAGLRDALREDPDVLVVGEMRDAESMRMVLAAAETGHQVFATMHSSNTAEALYRIMMSFQAEAQPGVLAQLADVLIAVVAQRLIYRPKEKLLVPVCEILVATHAVRNLIRKGENSKFISALQTGAQEGMWTFERYQEWIENRTRWVIPPTPSWDDPKSLAGLSGVGVNLCPPESSENLGLITVAAPTTPEPALARLEPESSHTPDAAVSNVISLSPSRDQDWNEDLKKKVNEKLRLSKIAAENRRAGHRALKGESKQNPRPLEFTTRPNDKPLKPVQRDPVTGLMVHEDGRFDIPAVEYDIEELSKRIKPQS